LLAFLEKAVYLQSQIFTIIATKNIKIDM